MHSKVLERLEGGQGFIAALDQSGGSTPKTLKAYGIDALELKDDLDMFDKVHEMRSRVITTSAFNSDRILGAILFEDTVNRTINGTPTPTYLWAEKKIIPFLKIDKGLEAEESGCQKMKAIPDLHATLVHAKAKGIMGTKMRSVIKEPNQEAIGEIVKQQFEVAQQVLSHGLVPIIEPEVDIHAENKELIEVILRATIEFYLDKLPQNDGVILKLTLPTVDNYYSRLVTHNNTRKVVALSGGYSREQANAKLEQNSGVIASFSRALLSETHVTQSDEELNSSLDGVIESIYRASIT